jgi:hypothetical protein
MIKGEVFMTVPDETRIADDVLRGAKNIGDEIGETEKRVYYLFGRGLLHGVGKQGGLLIGSRRRLREGYDRITQASAEPPALRPSHLERHPRRTRPLRPAVNSASA